MGEYHRSDTILPFFVWFGVQSYCRVRVTGKVEVTLVLVLALVLHHLGRE